MRLGPMHRSSKICLVSLTALGVLYAIVPAASPATSASLPIRHGVGIGPINLGMTGAEVRRAIGKPRAVIERRVIRGQPYVEFEYQYGAWNVGLLGRRGSRRVVLVGTGLTRHRTPEGLGVDSTGGEVSRRLRGRLQQRECWLRFGKPTQWYVRRGSAETVFFPHWGYSPDPQAPARIQSVEVRAAPVLGCLV